MAKMVIHNSGIIFIIIFSPDVREFFSLDNPKNAETNDDDEPGADESDAQVTFSRPTHPPSARSISHTPPCRGLDVNILFCARIPKCIDS